MQDLDRVAHIETLPKPAGARRVRMELEAGCFVSRSERFDGIVVEHCRRWDIGQRPSVRPSERQFTVGKVLYLVSLFVDGSVMAAAEHREVRERRGPAVGPVTDVVALAER